MGRYAQEQPKGDFMYRPVRRMKLATGEWGPWMPFAPRVAYGTLGAARNVLSTRKNEVERYYATEYQWKVQRAPSDAWEDVNE